MWLGSFRELKQSLCSPEQLGIRLAGAGFFGGVSVA